MLLRSVIIELQSGNDSGRVTPSAGPQDQLQDHSMHSDYQRCLSICTVCPYRHAEGRAYCRLTYVRAACFNTQEHTYMSRAAVPPVVSHAAQSPITRDSRPPRGTRYLEADLLAKQDVLAAAPVVLRGHAHTRCSIFNDVLNAER